MIKVPIGGLLGAIQEQLDEITTEAQHVVFQAALEGADATREFIATRGTAKSGKRGRIETSEMIDSVDAKVLSRSPQQTTVRFGLGRGPHWSDDQELGFTHNRSGEWVPGMFAVTDAREVAFQYIRRHLRDL